MRALAISWALCVTTAIAGLSWSSWSLHRAHVAEHNHARRAESAAELAGTRAAGVARAQQALDQRTDAKLRQLAEAWERELGMLCSTLEVLVRMTAGRAALPADGREVCPGIEPRTGGARHGGGR